MFNQKAASYLLLAEALCLLLVSLNFAETSHITSKNHVVNSLKYIGSADGRSYFIETDEKMVRFIQKNKN